MLPLPLPYTLSFFLHAVIAGLRPANQVPSQFLGAISNVQVRSWLSFMATLPLIIVILFRIVDPV